MSDGRLGIERQAVGLAEALGFTPRVLRLKARWPWRALPPRFWLDPLAHLDPSGDIPAPPWPDVVIGCGRLSVAPNRAIRRLAGGRSFCIQIQDPKVPLEAFDAVLVPQHDKVEGHNVITTLGSIHGFSDETLAEAAARFAPLYEALPRPRVGVLIGGNSRTHRLTEENIRVLGEVLARWAREAGAGLMITPSRRTAPESVALLRRLLGEAPSVVWDGESENPYLGMLGLADVLVVTGDSVNMATEAAFTGKPIYIAPIQGGTPKFRRFHAALAAAGISRPLEGPLESWDYPPLRESERAARELTQRIQAWRQRRPS